MEEGNTYQPLKKDSKRNNGIYQPVIKETMVSLWKYILIHNLTHIAYHESVKTSIIFLWQVFSTIQPTYLTSVVNSNIPAYRMPLHD